MTTRRGFLLGMLALGAAPAIVRADSLMQQASDRLTAAIRDDQYVVFVHPSWEEAMRTLAVTGSASLIYRGEVGRIYA